jgi:MFS superfamily sulfate permease-like transporter
MKPVGSLATSEPGWCSRLSSFRSAWRTPVASGLPGVCGLYATIISLVAYALFGPSRILVLGPDSSWAAIMLGVTAPLAAGDTNRLVAHGEAASPHEGRPGASISTGRLLNVAPSCDSAVGILEDLGIESEFEVDCLLRVVDGVLTFGVPFERAAFLGRARYLSSARVRHPGIA